MRCSPLESLCPSPRDDRRADKARDHSIGVVSQIRLTAGGRCIVYVDKEGGRLTRCYMGAWVQDQTSTLSEA
jgi:hypothetical protein